MIRKFKNGYYTESRDADVRRGDLLAVGGVGGGVALRLRP